MMLPGFIDPAAGAAGTTGASPRWPGRRGWRPGLLGAAVMVCAGANATNTPIARAQVELTLPQLRALVLQRNEGVQMKLLDAEIGRLTYEAERGIFEPAVVASYEHTDSRRTNTTQQAASLRQQPYLTERNNLYTGGLELLVPSGARFRTGYTLRELDNNLQFEYSTNLTKTPTRAEYETFIGVSLTQPLLRNFGPGVTMARIRLAAVASEVAFQEYRRQMMLSMGQAEALYWDLYLLQERERLARDSLATADKLLTDNQGRLEVGRGAEVEVLQAEAGVSLRQARLNDARQRVYEAGTRLGSFYSHVASGTNALPRAADRPTTQAAPDAADSYVQAFALNPDFLIRRSQLETEKIRVKYTQNQRLPQLDLKASYGLNGLDFSPGGSWDAAATGDTPAWTIGLELRVPITGGLRERREYQAAKLAKERALLGLKEIEVQVFNAIDAALQKRQLYQDSVVNFQIVADRNEKLLSAQQDLLAVGKINSKAILETEEVLFESRVAVVESLVLYQKALIELELVSGTLLEERQIEISREDLRFRTEQFLRQRPYTPERVNAAQRRAVAEVNRAARL